VIFRFGSIANEKFEWPVRRKSLYLVFNWLLQVPITIITMRLSMKVIYANLSMGCGREETLDVMRLIRWWLIWMLNGLCCAWIDWQAVFVKEEYRCGGALHVPAI
jgi:hypothetical protein